MNTADIPKSTVSVIGFAALFRMTYWERPQLGKAAMSSSLATSTPARVPRARSLT
ncbi:MULTISPECIES: hypothetical protein [unclassified Streptomyces]|uniref:hypothetical protein n=1 Tax=unclassified Streptomyces TaxID=2593676 RepID=UPI0022500205|nr:MULTISPECIES: hypothetical protein [unclassified Streptomyces]MCX5328225.1 hypothetical protein [Streptomyces sp. NBC_00140]MCX5357634.1 hypothetical protein [Streptomyces sp. NBC_00124]